MKDFTLISVVDNVRITGAINPVEIKTPSGQTIYKGADMGMAIELDLYHPGNLAALELLYRGLVTNVAYDGETTVAGEDVTISFFSSGGAFPLPGYNGDKTAVTVNSVKLASNTATTYTATTDYTVAVDADTGISYLVHVGGGSIPVGTEIVVNYDYDPGEGSIMRPVNNGVQRDRFVVIDCVTDCSDATKYRRYYLPHAFVVSDLLHQLLEYGQDNTSPNILPIRFEYAMPDACSTRSAWYWEDRVNI
ncbi:hypothetical protein [Blastopirellula marina]|uniref:Uncharacterized protein n=1 Tax=Blastopirellula marina TaxID=124 RepID=A0A2S8GSI2_9BACT|nr:hypothetical protein [Blastopirellula marina]PQO47372.1 hypothetical protein C5Y93_04840 [Blastopirellula marina]